MVSSRIVPLPFDTVPSEPAAVGRPPIYSEDVRQRWGGAPRLGLRLPPELYEWVQEQGGSHWVHQRLQQAFQTHEANAPAPKRRPWTATQSCRFLRTLHRAYCLHCDQPHGLLLRLLDLYEVLTMLPEARQAYSLETFTWQVHQLDYHTREVAAITGLAFRLDRGATAARNRKNLLVFPRQERTMELTYYGLEFLPPPSP